MKQIFCLLFFLSSVFNFVQAQMTDSISAKSMLQKQMDKFDSSKVKSIMNKHAATTSAVMSALLPGLGQAYNKKPWKIPIIYAVLGGLGYGIYYNGTNYSEARTAYLSYVIDTFKSNNIVYKGSSNPDQIQAIKENYKNTRDMFSIIIAVAYALNIVDAAVDAHMFKYDVSDDLSLELKPHFHSSYNTYVSGVQLKVSF
jgi:hypothetical protein